MSGGPGRARPSPGGSGRTVFAGVAGALATLLVVLLALAALSLWIYRGAGPKARSGARTVVVLRRGAGVAEIGSDLQQAGVIVSAPLFLAVAQATGAARHMRAGEYAFPSRASLAQVVRQLRLGLIVHHRITIPEGLSSREAVAILDRSEVLSGAVAVPPEGALLPETYEVVRGQTRASLVKRMEDDRDRRRAPPLGGQRGGRAVACAAPAGGPAARGTAVR